MENLSSKYLLSFIVPVYNVEPYLNECLDSLLKIQIQPIEIIVINDGSTDQSGSIADHYALHNKQIKVIHQENQGLSNARNRGMEVAEGEYISFIDSDDWLLESKMEMIYNESINQQVDMIMGNVLFVRPDGQTYTPFNSITANICHTILSGKECFSELMKQGAFPPMVSSYLYRRAWLQNLNLHFENVVHEDELWSTQALCLAESVYITNIDFYGYRQREGSIMNTLKKTKRIKDLIYISNQLIHFASKFNFDSSEKEVKSQLYVKAYMLYAITFTTLASVKSSEFILPSHKLYTIFKVFHQLSPHARKRVYDYYMSARKDLKNYLIWKTSYWVSNLSIETIENKHIILVYNTMWNYPLEIPIDQIPQNYIFTTDRRYLSQAQTVIFHLPTLRENLDSDLDKTEGQIWVAWTLECEENYSFLKDPELMELFDLRITYHQDADIIYSYMKPDFITLMKQPVDAQTKTDNICMLISSPINKSARQEYLKELMQEVSIDSYGKLFNNKKIERDNGRESKIELYKKYKFVIAFENACATDYVTEKFFEPLIVGAVPIYLGAPNIDEFAPGEHCFICANDFKSPKELAGYLKFCCDNPSEYQSFFEWKRKDLRQCFIEKVRIQEISPFIRLCHLLDKYKPLFSEN